MAQALTVAAGAGAGSGATASLSSLANDTRGVVTVTAAGTPAPGILATITWGGSWSGEWGTEPAPVVCANMTAALATELGTLSAVMDTHGMTMTIQCTGTPVATHVYPIAYVITP